MKKLFEVTYGRHLDMKGYVMAESHYEVKGKLFWMRWPVLSHIVELPIMTFLELQAMMPRLREEAVLNDFRAGQMATADIQRKGEHT